MVDCSIHDISKRSKKKNMVSDLLGHALNYVKDYHPNPTFPLYGFGGKIMNDPEENCTSKCFALGGKIYSPERKGVNNVLGAYFSNL